MMLTLATVVGLFNLFQFIENRFCKGIDGKDACCLGFSLNEKTRKCEKCSIGYFGKDCAKKCTYPVYGEDCQSICDCSKDSCHYSQGCLWNVENLSYQQLSSTKAYSTQFSTTLSTILMLNKTVYFSPVTTDFPTSTTEISGTTKDNYPHKNSDLLSNSVVITLFGIFVMICSIFVIAYIYFKCLRKNHSTTGINQKELQAHYKLLNLAAPETQSPDYLEPRVQLDADPTYLSPVFSNTETNQIPVFQENESRIDSNEDLEEPTVSRQRLKYNNTNIEIEPTISFGDQTEHFYSEIAQDV